MKLDYNIDNYGFIKIYIPDFNTYINDSLDHEGFRWGSDQSLEETTNEAVQDYFNKHLMTKEVLMMIKLKHGTNITWSLEHDLEDDGGFYLEVDAEKYGEDELTDEDMDALNDIADTLIEHNTLDKHHDDFVQDINEWWCENWCSAESPDYTLRLLEHDQLITEGYTDVKITDKTTQEEVQTHINTTWLSEFYSSDDYDDYQQDLINYCKQRWGYTITIPQKEVA